MNVRNTKEMFILNTFAGMTVIILTLAFSSNDYYIKFIFPIFVLISVLFMIIHYARLYGSIVNFSSLLLLSLWIFGMGRQFTFLFGFSSYSSYYGSYTIESYGMAYLFSYMCVYLFYIGSVMNLRCPCSMSDINVSDFDLDKLKKVLSIVLGVCLIPMLWYYIKLIFAALAAGYGSRQFDVLTANTGYLISLLREWGVLSTLALLTISYITNQKSVLLHAFYFVITALSLLGGSRTEGLSMLLILVLLYSEKTKRKNVTTIITVIMLLLVAGLIPYLFELRKNLSNYNNVDANLFDFSAVLSAIHEMGGTESALLIVRDTETDFQCGKSLLLAFLNTLFNFLPSSIRPDFSFIGPNSLAYLYSRKLGLNYGLGFSLPAEAYLNFKWAGCILFFVIGYAFSAFIQRENRVSTYISKVLFVFLLFTMARRESKDLFTEIMYYWFPFELLLNKMMRSDNKRNKESIQRRNI